MWSKDELKQIRAAYLGAHKRLKEVGVAKDQRNPIAKAEADAVKQKLLNERMSAGDKTQ